MSAPVHLREFRFPADYDDTLRLWASMDKGMRVGRSDSPEEIEKKLQRDPDLFLLAEMNSKIVGSVIGGYDGRRGMVYHLAVQSEARRHGVATQLLNEVEKRLQAKGCVKCYLFVFADNAEAIQFYEQRGWNEMTEDRFFAKELS